MNEGNPVYPYADMYNDTVTENIVATETIFNALPNMTSPSPPFEVTYI